ncbi:DNA-3-methyladenine glycosylase family protein [Caldalkalibacillus mannanilyticus]|uniref:DNA-3-methyladenine glycosylase family protein n=1 Tax=Caldalkalibacillus mannanilyticus TaxID=1418 RepID=UPI00046ACEF7|nr:DNA-3-methyladenine glycosylase [Caldalkalibacillus mannanilyticus]
MNGVDQPSYLEICPPVEFDAKECLTFLSRSELEMLYKISDGYVYKLFKVRDEMILSKIGFTQKSLKVEFPVNSPSKEARDTVAAYIWEWFDMDKDIGLFYKMAKKDEILSRLVHTYHGLRIMCIPDLFEALTWAIIGQQINLTFAYTLKQRFIEEHGDSLVFEGETYWLYPTHEKIAALEVEDLRELKFSTRKAEYVIGVAKAMANGELKKEELQKLQDSQDIRQALMNSRGIGAWTADYVIMKCFRRPDAFPIADVGLHNALKLQLGRECKPTIEEIKELGSKWEGWQAYATFYLWRSLL